MKYVVAYSHLQFFPVTSFLLYLHFHNLKKYAWQLKFEL